MSQRGLCSVPGTAARLTRPAVSLSAASGFLLALTFVAGPAGAAPAPATPLANPAHHHAVTRAATAAPAVQAAPAVAASAPVHTFHPAANALDAPQDPGHLGSGVCYSTNPSHNCTLRAAVQEANAEGAYIAIALTSGTYHLTIPPSGAADGAAGNLVVSDPQTVTFTGAGITHTFVDATGMGDRVVQVLDHGVARMSGFTIQNGNAAQTSDNTDVGHGGGIDVSSPAAALVLQSMRVTKNTARFSGGGVAAQGSVWATNSQFTTNVSEGNGGGFYADGNAQLVNDTITGNTAAFWGGGLDLNSGGAAVQGGSVSGNHIVFPDGADARGGGVYVSEGSTLVRTTISNNTIAPDSTATSGTARGGGIFVEYGLDQSDHLTIRNNTVSGLNPQPSGCNGDSGGGIFDHEGFALTNSVVGGNKALDGLGGGIFNCGDVEQLVHVTVSGNSAAGDGGGLYAWDVLFISRSAITGNTSGHYGGGMFSDDGQQIDQSLIANNHAQQGGGIYNEWQILMTNDTLTGNVASGSPNAGGAILNSHFSSDSTLQLTNVTISGNRSDVGGGIAQFGGGVTVHNTIIANNRMNSSATDSNCDVSTAALTDAGNNIDSGHTCALNGPGSRSGTNPRLGALANNGGPTRTMALLAGSPAINTGSGPAPAVDQRGVKRDSHPDIGAFEKK